MVNRGPLLLTGHVWLERLEIGGVYLHHCVELWLHLLLEGAWVVTAPVLVYLVDSFGATLQDLK